MSGINTDPISSGEKIFITSFNETAEAIHSWFKENGFWADGEEVNDGELIALIHSELSEALEALRHGNPPDDKIPDFNGYEAELADAIIRIMDLSAAKGLRVGEAIIAKAKFNKTRAHKHNKLF